MDENLTCRRGGLVGGTGVEQEAEPTKGNVCRISGESGAVGDAA